MRILEEETGEGILAALRSPEPPRIEALTGALINDMATLPGGLDLILDDYHLIDSESVHRIVSFLLEHLPEARPGLAELSRVMKPGGRMLLLTTEDNFSGAWTSRFWCCRTYNRKELFHTSQDLGLIWKKELWFTRMHKLLRAGGICVEIEKQ